MNSGKWFEREDRRNTTVERVDRSGRFKVIDHYDEKGVRKTIIRRLDTRFTKGQSGNPKGRPKGSLNATTLLKEIFNTTVPVREGDRRQFMSRAEAMLRATFANGLRGDARSLTTIMDLLEMTGYLDVELNRQWAPSIQEEHPRDMEEWYLLGPHRESERKRYLVLAEEEEARERGQNQSAEPEVSQTP